MEINKQLFEDVLSGKLKGTFVLRNQLTCNSDELIRNTGKYKSAQPYNIKNRSYSPNGTYLFNGESNFDIIDFIPKSNMKENELTIEIPEGKEVDWDESKKQNKIVLKNRQLTYEDVCKKLFENKESFYIHSDGYIGSIQYDKSNSDGHLIDPNNAPIEHQLECILAKNKLATIAVYLNNGWKPDFSDRLRVFVIYNEDDNTLKIDDENSLYARAMGHTIFKSKELAKQAIEILGEETVKLALEPLGI